MAQQSLIQILCIGDSRLRHLEANLIFPGATMGFLLYQLRLLLQSRNTVYQYIVVMGGICDLTTLTKVPTKRLTPAYDSVSLMVENFERIHAIFRKSAALFTTIPIIYLPLVGVNLVHYSNNDMTQHMLQPIIDQSIPLIHIMIKQINGLNVLPTPNIAHSIHHCHGRRGKYRTRYCRLFDGCHPDFATQLLWTQEILKSITNFVYAWK